MSIKQWEKVQKIFKKQWWKGKITLSRWEYTISWGIVLILILICFSSSSRRYTWEDVRKFTLQTIVMSYEDGKLFLRSDIQHALEGWITTAATEGYKVHQNHMMGTSDTTVMAFSLGLVIQDEEGISYNIKFDTVYVTLPQ